MKKCAPGDYRIPLEEVMEDWMTYDGIISRAARNYFYENYADEKTRKRMELEDRVQAAVAIGAIAFLGGLLAWTVITEFF